MRTLYLCYFGVREPLVQTQVVPYLRALARSGIGGHLLTFEPAGPRGCHTAAERRAVGVRLAEEGIAWHRAAYHKRPSLPATMYDVAAGVARAAWLVRRFDIDVIHARSHVPALMAMTLKRLLGRPYVFDFRGLMADEYADTGHWSRTSLRFRGTKRMERALLRQADGIVTLTAQVQEYLFASNDAPMTAQGVRRGGRPIEVIPCCVDLSRFHGARDDRERLRRELGFSSATVIAYLGGLGGMYLTDELAEFTAAALRAAPDARLLAMTQSDPEPLRHELQRRGVPEAAAVIRYVEPVAVPAHLGAADLAVSLIRPGFSKVACSPTKIAEYLAAGLPIASNTGIGDVDGLLRSCRVGVVLEEMTSAAYGRAFTELCGWLETDRGLIDRCRDTAREWFDLETVGGPAYVRLYQELMRQRRWGAGIAVGADGTADVRRRAGLPSGDEADRRVGVTGS